MSKHAGHTNVKQAIPYCLGNDWRPTKYAVIGKEGDWHAVVLWTAESGQQNRTIDARGWMTREEATGNAEELLRKAKRAYSERINAIRQQMFGNDG